METPYCGSKTVPKNRRLGSMKECAELGKVNYYGVKKVDTRILNNIVPLKKLNLDKVRAVKIGVDARLKKLNKDFVSVKDAEKKKTIKKEITKTEKELEKATKEYKDTFKKIEEKKANKSSSKVVPKTPKAPKAPKSAPKMAEKPYLLKTPIKFIN